MCELEGKILNIIIIYIITIAKELFSRTAGPPRQLNPNSIKDALLRWVQNRVQEYPVILFGPFYNENLERISDEFLFLLGRWNGFLRPHPSLCSQCL